MADFELNDMTRAALAVLKKHEHGIKIKHDEYFMTRDNKLPDTVSISLSRPDIAAAKEVAMALKVFMPTRQLYMDHRAEPKPPFISRSEEGVSLNLEDYPMGEQIGRFLAENKINFPGSSSFLESAKST